ncbi:hypothetical protein RUND412_010376 [Rhizina undulata]
MAQKRKASISSIVPLRRSARIAELRAREARMIAAASQDIFSTCAERVDENPEVAGDPSNEETPIPITELEMPITTLEPETPTPTPEPEIPIPVTALEMPTPATESKMSIPIPEPKTPIPIPESENPNPIPKLEMSTLTTEPETPIPLPESENPNPIPESSASAQQSSDETSDVSSSSEEDEIEELNMEEEPPNPSTRVRFSKYRTVRRINPHGRRHKVPPRQNRKAEWPRAVYYQLYHSKTPEDCERGLGVYHRIKESDFDPGSETQLVFYHGGDFDEEIPVAIRISDGDILRA